MQTLTPETITTDTLIDPTALAEDIKLLSAYMDLFDDRTKHNWDTLSSFFFCSIFYNTKIPNTVRSLLSQIFYYEAEPNGSFYIYPRRGGAVAVSYYGDLLHNYFNITPGLASKQEILSFIMGITFQLAKSNWNLIDFAKDNCKTIFAPLTTRTIELTLSVNIDGSTRFIDDFDYNLQYQQQMSIRGIPVSKTTINETTTSNLPASLFDEAILPNLSTGRAAEDYYHSFKESISNCQDAEIVYVASSSRRINGSTNYKITHHNSYEKSSKTLVLETEAPSLNDYLKKQREENKGKIYIEICP